MLRRLFNQIIIASSIAALPSAGVAANQGGFIDTPDSCYQVERLENDTVYLAIFQKGEGGNACTGKPGRAFIKSTSDKVKIIVEGKLWKEMTFQPISLPDVDAIISKAGKASITIPANSSETSMKKEAEKLNSYYQSDEFQSHVKAETERIKREVFGDAIERYYPDEIKQALSGKLGSDERVYVFVSSSMPLQTVRNYAASISKFKEPGIMMVMRGFVGGMAKIRPTVDFTAQALKTDPACDPIASECEALPVPFGVDPLLFRRYGIDRVPAVVYVKGMKKDDAELSEGDNKNASITNYWLAYGDAKLEFILDAIQKVSGSKSLGRLLELY